MSTSNAWSAGTRKWLARQAEQRSDCITEFDDVLAGPDIGQRLVHFEEGGTTATTVHG